MAVTFNKTKNYYSAYFNGGHCTYSVNKFGPLAEEMANISFKSKKKIYHIIEEHDNHAIMKIYHVPTDSCYDVYLDLEDVAKVENHKWYINVPQNARTYYVANDKLGKLHRYLMSINDSSVNVDHIDRNGLNNTKENLRLVSTSLNKKNMNVRADNKFGCNGISLDKNSYRVSWQENGRQHSKKFCINKYDNALEEAIMFRKEKELIHGYL